MQLKPLLLLCMFGLFLSGQQSELIDSQSEQGFDVYCEFSDPMYVYKQYNMTFIILNLEYEKGVSAKNFWFNAQCDEKLIFSTTKGLTDEFILYPPYDIGSGLNITVVVIPQYAGTGIIDVSCGSDNIEGTSGSFPFILKESLKTKTTITLPTTLITEIPFIFVPGFFATIIGIIFLFIIPRKRFK